MHPRSSNPLCWRYAFAAAGFALLSACSESPVAPHDPTAPTVGVGNVNGAVDATFVRNSRKYSDKGTRPANGRAGSATMTAWTLIAQDGSAQVEVVAGSWNGWTRGQKSTATSQPRLARTLLKVYDPSGALLYSRTETIGAPTATLAATGVVHGGRVQVQGAIEGADPNRVGVVTVDAPIAKRPDFAVTAVEAAPRAKVDAPVNIVGVVQELNGDVGAWADCVLYVDGREADRAHGIWVDAGGTASCLFSQVFRSAGGRELTVALEGVAPGDYDSANNRGRGVVEIYEEQAEPPPPPPPGPVPSPFRYSASFDDRTSVVSILQEDTWNSTDMSRGGEDTRTTTTTERAQFSSLYAHLPYAAQFPLGELSARQFTSVESVHGASFADVTPDWTYDDGSRVESCVSRSEEDAVLGRAWVYLCTYAQHVAAGAQPMGWTTVQYERYAGEVTYVSRGYSRYWNRDENVDDVYTWNDTNTDVVGQFARYGSDFTFTLQLVEGGRTSSLTAIVPLLPFSESMNEPRTCSNWSDAWITSSTCTTIDRTASGASGVVAGEPQLQP